MDRFLVISSFVRVAEAGSFAEAARQLRVSRSTVTERVQQLETFVGAPLFVRSTRSVRLTDLGRRFLGECTDLVARAGEVVDQMREVSVSPSGRLRIHAPPGFVLGHLSKQLQAFQARFPDIVLDIVVNDAVVDPVKEGFDCTLQGFPPSSEELISRRLFVVRLLFCASPTYLRRWGVPREPKDLQRHRIGWYSGYSTRDRVVFNGGKTGPVVLDLKPALLSNSVLLLRDYALAHACIVCVPTFVSSKALEAGDLVPVLSRFHVSSTWMRVVYAKASRSSMKLRLFIDSLVADFAGTPPWDTRLVEAGLIPKDWFEETGKP